MAGLAKQIVAVPVAAGLDESIDERQLGADGFAKLTNCVMRKRDVWSKRQGFSIIQPTALHFDSALEILEQGTGDPAGAFTADVAARGPARALHSTGRELLVVGSDRLYSLDEQSGKLIDKGYVSPCAGQTTRTFYGNRTYRCADMAVDYSGRYVLHAAISWMLDSNGTATPTSTFALEATVSTIDGDVVLKKTILYEIGLAATRPHGVKCCGLNGKIIIVVAFGGGDLGAGATPGSLQVWEWLTSTPHVPPVSLGNLHTDLYVPESLAALEASGASIRRFDVVPVYRGEYYIVGWASHTDFDLDYALYSKAHVSAHSGEIFNAGGGSVLSFAFHVDNEIASGSVGLYAAISYGGGVDCVLIGREFTTSAMGALSFTTTVYSLGADEAFALEVGVVAFYDEDGFNTLLGAWTLHIAATSSTPETMVVIYGSTDLAGSDLSSVVRIHNALMTSKPFAIRNRVYMACSGLGPGEPFTYNVVYDLDSRRDGYEMHPRIAALYDIGLGRSGYFSLVATQSHSIGSCNSVDVRDDVVRFSSLSIAAYMQSAPQTTQYAADLVTLDFSSAPSVSTVFDGTALVGGGYLAWYSGYETFELSFPTAPGIYQDTVDANDAFVASMWEHRDSAGIIHRGPVFPAVACDTAATVVFNGYTYPCSMKLPPVTATYFANVAGSTLLRVQSGIAVDRNIETQHITEGVDAAAGTGPAIYTDGGIIEAISPEGARLVKAAFGRVWLADFFRGARVQWSKPVAPGTADEGVIAPEFNPVFGKLSPLGEEFTGVAEIDDQLILFTRDRVYGMSGPGPNNLGIGGFSELRAIMTDTGCTDFRSVVEYQDGVLFRGERGIYRLDRTGGVRFIGFPVIDETESYPTVTSARLNAKAGEIYFTCTTADGSEGIVLVYNYLFNVWSKWEIRDGQGKLLAFVSAAMHGGTYYLLERNGRIWAQRDDTFLDASVLYVPMAVEIGWAKSSAWQRVSDSIPLLARKDAFDLRVEMFADFEDEAFKDETIVDSELLNYEQPATRLQPRVSITRQESQAYKVRFSDSSAGSATTTGEGFTFSGLLLQIGAKRGVPRLPTAQRA